MELNIPLHTIILTVAPTGAGKTYFCNNVLIKQIENKYPDLNIQYISSDDIRRDLLGRNAHKYDIEMDQVSGQAFDLLKYKLKASTSFSVSAEIIIVDTTGLSNEFRDELISFGRDVNYNVLPIVFDYKEREEYFAYNVNENRNYLISKHINKLRKEVLKTITKSKYKDFFKIKSNDFTNIVINIQDYDFYKSHFLPETDKEYVVVGDLHGCLDEFKELITEFNCTIEDGIIKGDKIFIVQDYVDKGTQIPELIDFIYENYLNNTIVPLLGNHENYVYKRITGQIKANSELEETYFNSVALLLDSPNHAEKFRLLVMASRHFYRHKLFFVNHAPCDIKYLGKIDNTSLKAQRNFVYPKHKDFENNEKFLEKLEESLSFIKKYTNWTSKPVVWGHIALKVTQNFANIRMIDVGIVSGNKLAGIAFADDGRSFTKVIKSKKVVDEDKYLPVLFSNKIEKDVKLDELEVDDYRRIRYLIWNKINFIAGTMCPADKDIDKNELESLSKGLEYYKSNGVERVILQKKYMGSNSVNYINADIEKCYSTSRNGYLIDKKVDLTSEYQKLINKFKDYLETYEYIVINSELMPWSSLGKSLIDEDYTPVSIGLSTEKKLLDETDFYGKLDELLKNDKLPEYRNDFKKLKKSELSSKYGHRDYETFKNIIDFEDEYISSDDYVKGMEIFKRQLELFGKDGEVSLKPFNLLKMIGKDGEEITFFDESNIDLFKKVSDDDYCVIDFKDDAYFYVAKKFYDVVTTHYELEGVVIKPERNKKGVAPALKCRNENYLTITYGFDYKKNHKYKKLIDKKNIRHKLKLSINEYEIGKKMMGIKHADIIDGNQEFVNACAKMIIDEKELNKLDPRL